MKISGIKKREHAIADFSYVPLVFMAPTLAGFINNKPAVVLCKSFALTALAYTLCTKANWGLIKIIPYKIHAGLDVASGMLALATLAIPNVRNDRSARNTFIGMGITGLVIGTLSFIGASKNIRKAINQ